MRRASVLFAALFACTSTASFEGLAPARNQGGPVVRFVLSTELLPEIPFPSDILTRPDTTSPTGVRLNATLIAPTALEQDLRSRIDALDGFGTFAPISVSFDKDLDVLDLYNRQNDADPANDGVYVVDLTTGATVPLDFNGGHFPATLIQAAPYFPGDPAAGAYNLLFPVTGPLANFLHPGLPHDTLRQQADDLLTFYERETRTLIIRPVVPLAQQRRYAVVLTDRVRGTDGAPISSPHSAINHASQTRELQPLTTRLPAGVPLSSVAYTWAFTTQSITADLETVRSGLQGNGPLQLLSQLYAVQTGISSTVYSSLLAVLQETGPYTPGGPAIDPSNYVLTVAQLESLLNDPQLQGIFPGIDATTLGPLQDTWRYVDYFVSGTFVTPNFLDNGPGRAQEQTIEFDPRSTIARVQPARINFLLAVPKQRPEVGHLAPFPTVIAGHRYQSSRVEPILTFSGTFAKFGVATVAIDAFGHGLTLLPAQEQTFRNVAQAHGLAAFADAVLAGRARDLDNDGAADPGADFWVGDAFHTRDTIRQSVIDWIQLTRLLRTFDGAGSMTMGTSVRKAGDFNGDGIPDVGGAPTFPFAVSTPDGKTRVYSRGDPNPGADLFVFGESIGGILAAILPAVEPAIVAAAPVSAAGGLTDVELRTSLAGIARGVFLEMLGPIFVTCHFDATANACAPGTPDTLALVVQNLNRERDLPIAPLTLAPGQRVMVRNLKITNADCSAGPSVAGCSVGAADAQGQLQLPIAADWPSLQATGTKISVTAPGDRLDVSVLPVANEPRKVVNTYQIPTSFDGVAYNAGDPLTAPGRGFALARNTPALRRRMALVQTILEPADPVNYAAHWSHDLLAARTVSEQTRVAGPANALVVGTLGDPSIPVGTAVSLARAAGVVEMTQPDPAFGIPIDQVLVRGGVVEGIPATRRFDDPDGGVPAALPAHVRCDPGDTCTGDVLLDASGYSCDGGTCADALQAPRLDPPLQQQLVRPNPMNPSCPPNKRATGPGCYSTGASACNPAAPGLTALMLPYLARTGQSGIGAPSGPGAFNVSQFIANAVGRYFECRGREVRFDACQQGLADCAWTPQPPP